MSASRFRLFSIIIWLAVSGVPPASAIDEDREYLLRQAAANGELSLVQSLLEQGADVNGANKRGYTALILAVRGGHTYVIKHLVAAGAAVNFICTRLGITFAG